MHQWTSLACTFISPISDHVMFPREFSFCFFIRYAYICTCDIWRHLKETVPHSYITWSEMGKQIVQAKDVHHDRHRNATTKRNQKTPSPRWDLKQRPPRFSFTRQPLSYWSGGGEGGGVYRLFMRTTSRMHVVTAWRALGAFLSSIWLSYILYVF